MRRMWLHALALILALTLVGCATSRIDWTARVGNYTYDQAVLELGPPDKMATLTDGTAVAEWLTYRGHSGYSYYPYGPFYTPYYYSFPMYDPPSPDRYLRLTFGPDKLLKDWRRLARY